MKKAVIYARYSCDKQTEQSIEGQLRVCNDYAKANDILIVDKYIDQAMSGTNDKRPNFQRMLEDSKKKLWDYVIVYKFDRFSRNIFDSTVCEHELNKNGVKLLSAMEKIPDAPEGIVLKSLLQSMNQYYSDELAQKVKRGMKETRIKGLFQGGRILYGYKVDGRRVVVNEDEAKIVEYIFKQYNAGHIVDEIVDELNQKQITNRGEKWSRSTVYKMLANSKYIGKYMHDDELVDNTYPAIISDEIFKITAQRKKGHYPGANNKYARYLLKGKLVCGYCGKSFVIENTTKPNGKSYRYYKCGGKKVFKNGCKKTTLKKETLEEFVINEIIKKLRQPKIMEPLIDNLLMYQKNATKTDSSFNALVKEQKQTELALKNLLSAMESGIVNKTTNDRIIELETKLAEINKILESEKAKVSKVYTKEYLKKYYDKLLLEEPYLLINYLIKEIKLFDDKMEITFNSPIGESSDNQGFFFYDKKATMIMYGNCNTVVKSQEMDIEMYI